MGVSGPRKFGPTRADLKFRFGFSMAGLAMLAVAIAVRGLPQSAGGWEAVGIAALFFGGTAAWSPRKLIRRDHAE